MDNQVKIITTEDGSHSLYVPVLNETYHSTHGAITESRHVFIKEGFQFFVEKYDPTEIHLLEIGFGTGLNALLTYYEAQKLRVKVHYQSLEPYPLKKELYDVLNYHEHLDEPDAQQVFCQLHEAKWSGQVDLHEFFTLEKIPGKLEYYSLDDQRFDVVYFDAFAPNKQAEVWEKEVLSKVHTSMNSPGLLTTYCAKGQFKRDLTAIGFQVETIPGSPGKKEMVRAFN